MKLDSETQTGSLDRAESLCCGYGVFPTLDRRDRPRELMARNLPKRPFRERIEDYFEAYTALWADADCCIPRIGPAVEADEKADRERQADECITEIEWRLRHYPGTAAKRERWRVDFLRALRGLAQRCLGLPEAGLRLFFNPLALNCTCQFIRDAKAFDPTMSDASVFQALRNLWVIHNLQLLLDGEPVLSPAAFGYSMLYPWTDNYLDDPTKPQRAKADFGNWLDRRLAGACITVTDEHAAQVNRLLGLIEGCFHRDDYPEVYLSLRAVHAAQMSSLRQQATGCIANDQDILAITFQKGGTSVLTDAYLVRGRLSESEAEFMFGYGVLLQLMDDLQDLRNDLANRHRTIFTQQAPKGPLDEVTSRLWSFGQAVLWSSDHFAAPRFIPLKTLIQDNCKLLLFQSVARHSEFYSGSFAHNLEACSPFHFAYLRKQQAAFRVEFAKLTAFLRGKRGINSVLDVLDLNSPLQFHPEDMPVQEHQSTRQPKH